MDNEKLINLLGIPHIVLVITIYITSIVILFRMVFRSFLIVEL